jgi:hypothetical protein
MSLPLRVWPGAVVTLLRTFGTRGVRLRAFHEVRKSIDRFRAAPKYPVLPRDCRRSSAFEVDRGLLVRATDRCQAVARGDRIVAGQYQAYRWDWRPLPADSGAWLRHPRTGRIHHASAPWWKTLHLDPTGGDIKELWEPARFAWAYDLVRAWLLTRDDRYAATFYRQFQAWAESSPPFGGPHWSCGQETAIRSAALLYAEANLNGAPSSTAQSMARLEAVLAASGERISDALGYALSQRNNHALSEAAGLVMLGARFRDQHPEAKAWLDKGQKWLDILVEEQFASDGWYVQHSFTYQRLALDQLVLAERALRSVGRRLSDRAVTRIHASLNLLVSVIESNTGIVPNHGHNDGAYVHPITLADYRDFRPVITAGSAMWEYPLPLDIPPDVETAAWLGAGDLSRSQTRGDEIRVGESGWASVRVGKTAVFLRAGGYDSRPGHLDPLHLDVRFGDVEAVVDPGTFAYNAQPPWNNGLAGGAVHNGPVLGDVEPGIRGPRFLWLAWPDAVIESVERIGATVAVVAQLVGRVRRTVRIGPDEVRVRDVSLDAKASRMSVHWTLHPNVPPSALSVDGETEIGVGEPDDVRGWFSPRYRQRIATTFVGARVAAGSALETRIRRIGP